MFLENKYTRLYYAVITAAKSRVYPDNGCLETHHILPRSLGGGDEDTNLVTFSAREHYISHLLLTKMTEGVNRQKMCWALHRMVFSDPRRTKTQRFTARQYETARRAFVRMLHEPQAYMTEQWKIEHASRVTAQWKDNTDRRRKMSETVKQLWATGKLKAETARKNGNHGFLGKDVHNVIPREYKGVTYYGWRELQEATGVSKRLYKKYYANGIDPTPRIGKDGPSLGIVKSDETRAKLSAANTGKVLSSEARAKLSAKAKGRVVSAETRAKMSASHKGKFVSKETRAKISEANRRRAVK